MSQQAPPKGIFSNIGKAKAMLDANYIRPGKYWMLINKCKVDSDRKGVAFIANEFTVIRALDNDNGQGHRLREDVCQLVKQTNDYFLSEVKSFVAGVMGIQAEDVGEDDALLVYDPEKQPLVGYVVEVHARNITLKDSNKDFTRVTYKREVKPQELLEGLDPEIISRYFPNGVLERLIAEQNKQASTK